jgi:Flp pilus assembly protein TadD
MMNLNAVRGIAAVNVVALGVLLSACGDDRDAQARAASGGLAVAPTVTVPALEPESREDTVTPVPEVRVTAVTYAEAEGAFRKGRYTESTELFEAYVGTNPDNAFGHYMHGLSAWKSGDHAAAEQALTRAVELNGETVKIRTNLGRVLLERGRASDALPHLEKAVELDPTSHEVWRVLGNVYSATGRTSEAIESYRQALMLDDHDSWTMNNYGLVLIQLGRYDEAVLPLARAVELVPLSATFQNNLGVALERMGEIEGARGAFAAAVEADSTYEKARTSLERVEARLVDQPMEAPDLSVFAQQFVDEMMFWTSEEQHDC